MLGKSGIIFCFFAWNLSGERKRTPHKWIVNCDYANLGQRDSEDLMGNSRKNPIKNWIFIFLGGGGFYCFGLNSRPAGCVSSNSDPGTLREWDFDGITGRSCSRKVSDSRSHSRHRSKLLKSFGESQFKIEKPSRPTYVVRRLSWAFKICVNFLEKIKRQVPVRYNAKAALIQKINTKNINYCGHNARGTRKFKKKNAIFRQ